MVDFVTSDLHFFHKNIVKYCPNTRSHFTSIEEMNEYIVSEWNASVTNNDTVYILGDVSMGNQAQTVEIIKRLAGKKILVQGNHDTHLLKSEEFCSCFESIHQILNKKFSGNRVVMCHFPMLVWDQSARGSIMLHGHLHNSSSEFEHYRIRNVGYDYTGKVVSRLEDVINDALTSKVREL